MNFRLYLLLPAVSSEVDRSWCAGNFRGKVNIVKATVYMVPGIL